MGSSTKRNSMATDLTDANNETGIVEACDGFSICGFIAELREKDPKICWPFSKESASLLDQQTDSPSLSSVHKFRWFASLRCTRNIDADGTNDSGLPSKSTSITSTNGLIIGSSSVIPSQSNPNSPTAIDQENERNTDHIAGNAVALNEDVNVERSQNNDQRGNNAVVENEDVNCERSRNDNQRVTRSMNKVNPPPRRTYALRNKGKKVAVAEPVMRNKRAEKEQNEEQLALTILASAAAEVTPSPKASKSSKSLVISGVRCTKTRKVRTRKLMELSYKPETTITRTDDPSSSKKRKTRPRSSRKVSTAGAITINASRSVDAEHGGSEPTDSGLDISPIKGKKKNVRFQVDDELVQEEGVPEDVEDPYPPRAKRTKGKKKNVRFQADDELVQEEATVSEDDEDPYPPRAKRTKGKKKNVRFQVDDELLQEEATVSENDEDPYPPRAKRTKGKKKNVRFQADDELVQEEATVSENDEDPYPPRAKRSKKGKRSKRRRTTTAIDPSNKASSSVQPSLNENETVPSPPRQQGTEERVDNSLDDQLASEGYIRNPNAPVSERQDNNGMRPRDDVASFVPVFGSSSIPNTGRGRLGTGHGAAYLGGSSNNNQRSTLTTSTVVATQSSVLHKDASVSDRKGKGIMIQSDDESDNTQNDDRPDNEVLDMISNNLPQEVPQKPKTPFLFDLNETYEDVPSPEHNTNEPREEEDTVPVRSEQQSTVEPLPPRHQPYMPSPSMMSPPVQESRRSSILFPGHNPQWMRSVPVATHHHHHHYHPSPVRLIPPPDQFRAPSPPVLASYMIPPPQYHHHLSPPAPSNVDYTSMFAQAPSSSDTWNGSYYGPILMSQEMINSMDPRFRSYTPVGNIVFTPRHVHPVNQFNQVVELQRSDERPVFPRTISYQGRFQQRRNVASSSNASAWHAVNSSGSPTCVVSQYPGEISDIEPGNVYMVREEDLHVPERMAEFGNAGLLTESG